MTEHFAILKNYGTLGLRMKTSPKHILGASANSLFGIIQANSHRPSRRWHHSHQRNYYLTRCRLKNNPPFMNAHGLKIINDVVIPFGMRGANLACIFLTFMVCKETTRKALCATGKVAITTCNEVPSGGT
jgi:hypothetical protein